MDKYLTKEEYEEIVKKDTYYKSRWNYLGHVVELARLINPRTTIEVGCRQVQIVKNSTIVDTKDIDGVDYIHDITNTPWPIIGPFDLFIALQVWEHLKDKQHLAFREVQRLCRMAIISVPWKWKTGHNDHIGINNATMLHWTNGVEPKFKIKCTIRKIHRMVYFYRFEET